MASPFSALTVLIIARNEERYIARCLDSVLASDYPLEDAQIIVVDGQSEDGTREIVRAYQKLHPSLVLIDNPSRIFAAGVNAGLRAAQGELVLILGTHADYEPRYLSDCVYYSTAYRADNVGGYIEFLPRTDRPFDRAASIANSHPFGVGSLNWHQGKAAAKAKQPQWVDTVYGGCYRRDVFDRIGLFNEELVRSSDMDFNRRLTAQGGTILLFPHLAGRVYRHSDLKHFWRSQFVDGLWVTYPLAFGRRIFKLRHIAPLLCLLAASVLVPLCFVTRAAQTLLVDALIVYAVAHAAALVDVTRGERRLTVLALVPIAIAVKHAMYAVGSAVGLFRALFSRRFWSGLARGFPLVGSHSC